MKRTFLWAHRGASCRAPENTMAAFAAALTSGADGIELDIHLTRDGVPVVLHDDTLERTTNASGPVADTTLEELRNCEAGSWFSDDFAGEPVPTLEEVLRAFGGQLRINVEIKDLQAGRAVLDLLHRYPATDSVVSSFDHHLLHHLRSADAGLPLAVLSAPGHWRQAIQTAKALSACAFHPVAEDVSRPMIAICRRLDLPVFPWTVDLPGVARSLVRAGISGLFTNDPQGIAAALAYCSQPGKALLERC